MVATIIRIEKKYRDLTLNFSFAKNTIDRMGNKNSKHITGSHKISKTTPVKVVLYTLTNFDRHKKTATPILKIKISLLLPVFMVLFEVPVIYEL
jgi:hypothetical protein